MRAFPAHDASKLPSAQYNFYVKEAYFGVTYSGFLQGPAIFTDTHNLRHLTKEATNRSDPSEPQPSESGHNPEEPSLVAPPSIQRTAHTQETAPSTKIQPRTQSHTQAHRAPRQSLSTGHTEHASSTGYYSQVHRYKPKIWTTGSNLFITVSLPSRPSAGETQGNPGPAEDSRVHHPLPQPPRAPAHSGQKRQLPGASVLGSWGRGRGGSRHLRACSREPREKTGIHTFSYIWTTVPTGEHTRITLDSTGHSQAHVYRPV